MLPVRLVVVRTIIIIVPFIALFLLFMLPISALVFDSATSISDVDGITQVMVISIASSATFHPWSDAAGQVPMRTLLVVIIMTPIFVLVVIDWIRYRCCVQHRLEAVDVRIDFLVIFGEMGVI
jgi:hypothetical protein